MARVLTRTGTLDTEAVRRLCEQRHRLGGVGAGASSPGGPRLQQPPAVEGPLPKPAEGMCPRQHLDFRPPASRTGPVNSLVRPPFCHTFSAAPSEQRNYCNPRFPSEDCEAQNTMSLHSEDMPLDGPKALSPTPQSTQEVPRPKGSYSHLLSRAGSWP